MSGWRSNISVLLYIYMNMLHVLHDFIFSAFKIALEMSSSSSIESVSILFRFGSSVCCQSMLRSSKIRTPKLSIVTVRGLHWPADGPLPKGQISFLQFP